MRYSRQILWESMGKDYGIYFAKSMGYTEKTLGFIGYKLWDILSKLYEIYWAKTMGYCKPNIWDILGKTMGYIGQNYEIYLENYRIHYGID